MTDDNMQKKQAVEQRIRDLVEVDELWVECSTCFEDISCLEPLGLHHVLMAIEAGTDFDFDIAIGVNGQLYNCHFGEGCDWSLEYEDEDGAIKEFEMPKWHLDKPFNDQPDEVFDFLHGLLIENV